MPSPSSNSLNFQFFLHFSDLNSAFILKKMMYNMKIKNFFCGLTVSSPTLNCLILLTILKIFLIAIFFLKWKCSDLHWAVGSIPILIIPTLQFINWKPSIISLMKKILRRRTNNRWQVRKILMNIMREQRLFRRSFRLCSATELSVSGKIFMLKLRISK